MKPFPYSGILVWPWDLWQLAEYVASRDAQGLLGVALMPHGSLCRIAVTTPGPLLFGRAVQIALDAGALIETLVPSDGCFSVIIPAIRALAVARLLSTSRTAREA